MPRKTLAREAKEFVKSKRVKYSAADRTILRTYMANILGSLIINAGLRTRPQEILQQAFEYAILAKDFEKEKFDEKV